MFNTVVLVTVLLLNFGLVFAQCPSGYSICGNLCYVPTVHSCFSGVLCPVGFLACSGNQCYRPSEYSCVNGVLQQGGSVPPPPPPPSGEVLVFDEPFTSFDLSKWKHEITMSGGGNGEFQLFTNNRSVSYVRNGILYIRPQLTEQILGMSVTQQGNTLDLNGINSPSHCTSAYNNGCLRIVTNTYIVNPIASAKLTTYDSFAIQYGRIEIRAKMPKGDWLWPAIWMLPRLSTYGEWPSSGEIDICEARGNVNYNSTELGFGSVYSTLHWGPSWQYNGFPTTRQSKSLSDAFHTFGLYWDSTQLYTYIDTPSNRILTVDLTSPFFARKSSEWQGLFNPWQSGTAAAPFDQQFYLVLSLSVGGNVGYWQEPSRPWQDTFDAAYNFWQARQSWLSTWNGEDAALQIDSVKVWRLPSSTVYQK